MNKNQFLTGCQVVVVLFLVLVGIARTLDLNFTHAALDFLLAYVNFIAAVYRWNICRKEEVEHEQR